MSQNPFLENHFEIRWSRLTPEHVVPGVREALARAELAVKRVSEQSSDSLSFETSFLALENSTEELGRVWGKVTHLQSVQDSPALREAHNTLLEEVSSFYSRIPLNPALWTVLKSFAESPAAAQVCGVRRRLMEETLADFRQAGADLSVDKKARLESLQSELARLTQRYSENVLDATNAWQLIIEDENLLKGLPERARESARRGAAAKGFGTEAKPAWRFTLQGPSVEPVMGYAESEWLRHQVWSGSVEVGSLEPYDNAALVKRILELRQEKAALLGFACFADLSTQRRMAGSGSAALGFIDSIRARACAAFLKECSELEAFRTAHGGRAGLSRPWELGFWSERMRRELHDFDDEALRPYLPLDRVLGGLFELCTRVFGLQITERPAGSVEVWHPEVKFYEVRSESGILLGAFYADWHPRESKRGGAWMNYLITGGPTSEGKRAPHLGLMCGNLTPPAGGHPALLTHREAETVFHEFGHLLHHLLGEVEIKSLNGVNVAWDFVELPSQIMENWCWERESLDLFARHHQTGEPIPEELFQRMKGARTFRSGCMTMRQVQLARMDLLLHLETGAFLGGDLEAALRSRISDTMIPSDPPARIILRRFNHIFADPVGYAAGYYSYKWAEVLEADAFTRFQQEGVFSRKVGAEFVERILSRGNSEPPGLLFRSFMGRDPDQTALLRRAGLL